MKSVRYYGPKDIRIDEIPIPEIQNDELLVKIEGEPKFTGLPCRVKQTNALQIIDRIMPPEEEQEDVQHE